MNNTNTQNACHTGWKSFANRLLVLACFMIFIHACAPVPVLKLEDKVFEENYSYTIYNPEISRLQLSNNVLLEVEPVEPTYLNMITYLAAAQTGDTERLRFREIRNLQNSAEINELEKKRIEQLINVSDMLSSSYTSQFDSNIIEEILLAHSAQLGITSGTNDLNTYNNESEFPSHFNPFYVNERFLSTVKLTFTNRGSEVQRFRSDEIRVAFLGNTLIPHNNEYFDQRLQYSRQLDNVFNFNLPEEIVVGPGQSVSRYIGVQPLPNNLDDFSVQYISNDNFEIAEFTVNRINETNRFILKGFRLDDTLEFPVNLRQRDRYYILINDGDTGPINNNQFYINEDRISKESYVCGFFHRNLTARHSTIVTRNPVSTSDSVVHCISVDLDKAPEQTVEFRF